MTASVISSPVELALSGGTSTTDRNAQGRLTRVSNQPEIPAQAGASCAPARAAVEELILQHLDAAYNVARWMLRTGSDAEDVVQDAAARALKFSGSFRGGDGRAWFLAIVRNCCWTTLERSRRHAGSGPESEEPAASTDNPAAELEHASEVHRVRRAIEALPDDLREMIVMRDIEGLSYQQIAEVLGVPMGTVMSRLSRARDRARDALGVEQAEGGRA